MKGSQFRPLQLSSENKPGFSFGSSSIPRFSFPQHERTRFDDDTFISRRLFHHLEFIFLCLWNVLVSTLSIISLSMSIEFPSCVVLWNDTCFSRCLLVTLEF
ncbi:hypothetical protein L6164_004313 [Bauhinia variegata]|uniref:Uncharacterized protein n=1 Tax=Bauhinia variegata TaxID=167791 RepID=A0ACB9Q3Y8_BAUVA|nr:hypothetical protein L6164_004313 [Bauhinia variegata]